VAVVAADGSLLGLMCLKQRRTKFCLDADAEVRSTRDDGRGRGAGNTVTEIAPARMPGKVGAAFAPRASGYATTPSRLRAGPTFHEARCYLA